MPDELSVYRIENLIYPSENSMYDLKYETISEGNLKYNSPLNQKEFFWISGDGELPCANKKMIDFFKKWYQVRPQLRTGNLKDGFYAEKLNK